MPVVHAPPTRCPATLSQGPSTTHHMLPTPCRVARPRQPAFSPQCEVAQVLSVSRPLPLARVSTVPEGAAGGKQRLQAQLSAPRQLTLQRVGWEPPPLDKVMLRFIIGHPRSTVQMETHFPDTHSYPGQVLENSRGLDKCQGTLK